MKLSHIFFILAASQLTGGTVMTVLGPIDSAELGSTLQHEHILVDFIGAEQTGYHRWNKEAVVERVMPYLVEARELGFQAIVECTPAFLGRDPRLLATLSKNTGLHIITNTGYYGAHNNKFIPSSLQKLSTDQLAARWILEFEQGIENTGIKPGFIKIAVDRDPQLSAMHEKLVRAACRTHLKTGLIIACHTGPTETIFEMSKILTEEGVSQDALIWVHATKDSPQNQIKAAKLGLWVSIDNITDNSRNIDFITTGIMELREAGLLDRVLISHDAGWYRPGEPKGGNFRPYTALSTKLIPRLKQEGFKQEEIEHLLIENPRLAFEIKIRTHKVPAYQPTN